MNSYTCYYVIHACVFYLDTITCQKNKKIKDLDTIHDK